MSFNRTGTPQRIDLMEYNVTKEQAILCPKCKSILGYEQNDQNGLVRVGQTIILKAEKVVCEKCKTETK